MPGYTATTPRSLPVAPTSVGRAVSVSPAHFLAISLGNRWRTYADQHRKLQQSFAVQPVHELRVASRRLIAKLELLDAVIPSSSIEKARRALKRRIRSLSELRDIHVQRLWIERELPAFPEVILLRDVLERKERRLLRTVAAKVRSVKTRKFEKWIASVLQDLADKTNQARLSSAVVFAAREAFNETARRRRAIDVSDLETIHRTRIAFKKFRYMMESLSPGIIELSERQLIDLAAYQRKMGAIQDLAMMQSCLSAFIKEYRASEDMLRNFSRSLQQRRMRAVCSFMECADRIREFWPGDELSAKYNFRSAQSAA
jgi:CHAD domain-containing protein